jgi:L-threonylcarbamoyladenylate synthase
MITEPELERAASLLRNGGLVALPTETVYGLGANALDAEAVARIYTAKGRPATSPLIVHVANVEMARDLAREWTPEASLLADRYWPGPLTIIVPKSTKVPDLVTAGLDTVALRMPAHPVALEVIRRAGVPIAAPSANPFTGLSPTTAEHVRQSLGEVVDMILDGGPCSVGIESTVLSLVDAPVVLRLGMISVGELERALGRPVAVIGKSETVGHPSPGMHDRHYAPRTPLRLVRDGMLPRGRPMQSSRCRCHRIRHATPECCMKSCTLPIRRVWNGSPWRHRLRLRIGLPSGTDCDGLRTDPGPAANPSANDSLSRCSGPVSIDWMWKPKRVADADLNGGFLQHHPQVGNR